MGVTGKKKGGVQCTQTLQQPVWSYHRVDEGRRWRGGGGGREGEGGWRGLIAVNNGEMVCAWGAFCGDHNSSRESQGSAQMPE